MKKKKIIVAVTKAPPSSKYTASVVSSLSLPSSFFSFLISPAASMLPET
jgi:hypothetical protein